jgi:ribosomal protein S20
MKVGASPLLREMHGGGLSPLGGGLSPLGGSLYPLGGGITPLGGAVMSVGGAFGRNRMGFASGIRELYQLPVSYRMSGGGLMDSLKSAARSITKKLPNSLKSAAKEIGKTALDQATPLIESQINKGISKLPAAAQPFAQLGVTAAKKQATRGRKKIGMGVSEEAGLTPGQINAIAMDAARGAKRAPAMDRHEYALLKNVVAAKTGRGVRKL